MIRGTIEAIGHGQYTGPSSDASSLRLRSQDGTEHFLRNVRMLPQCASYVGTAVASGEPGIFLFDYHPNASTLFALKADGGFANDYEGMWEAPKLGRQFLIVTTILSVLAILYGILSQSLGMSICFTIVILGFGLWRWLTLTVLRMPPARKEVEAAFAEMKAG